MQNLNMPTVIILGTPNCEYLLPPLKAVASCQWAASPLKFLAVRKFLSKTAENPYFGEI